MAAFLDSRLLAFLGLVLANMALAEDLASTRPVPSRLSIVNLRALSFDTGFQGDPAQTISSASRADERAALFMVQGRPHESLIVLLPDEEVILATRSRERGSKEIRVRRMRTSPESGHAFQLDPKGTASITVGGTRDSILNSQASGDYEGHFFLTVMYQ